jgi:hypothetical protein
LIFGESDGRSLGLHKVMAMRGRAGDAELAALLTSVGVLNRIDRISICFATTSFLHLLQ